MTTPILKYTRSLEGNEKKGSEGPRRLVHISFKCPGWLRTTIEKLRKAFLYFLLIIRLDALSSRCDDTRVESTKRLLFRKGNWKRTHTLKEPSKMERRESNDKKWENIEGTREYLEMESNRLVWENWFSEAERRLKQEPITDDIDVCVPSKMKQDISEYGVMSSASGHHFVLSRDQRQTFKMQHKDMLSSNLSMCLWFNVVWTLDLSKVLECTDMISSQECIFDRVLHERTQVSCTIAFHEFTVHACVLMTF